jgi:hypothetical protein
MSMRINGWRTRIRRRRGNYWVGSAEIAKQSEVPRLLNPNSAMSAQLNGYLALHTHLICTFLSLPVPTHLWHLTSFLTS